MILKNMPFFYILLSSSLWAHQQKEIDKAIEVYGKDVQKILKRSQDPFLGLGIPQPSVAPELSCQSCQSQSVDSLIEESEQKTPKKVAPFSSQEVIIFVSLSMSEASLKQLSHEAQQEGARLVIQGLLNNSFQQTSAKIQALGIPIEIDPTLFELFEVTKVPTFIRCKMTPEGALKEGHDRLTGNIFLLSALEKLKSLGELS